MCRDRFFGQWMHPQVVTKLHASRRGGMWSGDHESRLRNRTLSHENFRDEPEIQSNNILAIIKQDGVALQNAPNIKAIHCFRSCEWLRNRKNLDHCIFW
jgi:hypothetical protein